MVGPCGVFVDGEEPLGAMRAAPGFSLVELLVGTAVTLVVLMLVSTLAVDALEAWRSDSARIDLQQRGRVAADAVGRALLESGAGASDGRSRGPLIRALPPIVPRRLGRRNRDPANTARVDALTLIRALPETEQAVLLLPAAAGTAAIEVAPASVCALPACGLLPGVSVVLFDGAGSFDIFSVLAATGQLLDVRHHGSGSAITYPAGTPVVAVAVTTFYLDPAARTLRRDDGDASDVPVVDDVVGMGVRYYGEARPPVRPRPGPGAANCLYEADGTYRAALLPALSPPGRAKVALDLGMLSDGPWCGTGDTVYDADLLRIRQVEVQLRLQAADPAVRGLDPVAFRYPGNAVRAPTMVSDVNFVVETAPRNLTGGW